MGAYYTAYRPLHTLDWTERDMDKLDEQEILEIFSQIQNARDNLKKLEEKLRAFQTKIAYQLVEKEEAAPD